jgi:hypothetical protein
MFKDAGIRLGRFEKVELREVFESEAEDFTPWLARQENLKLLGEAIGVDLDLESQEKAVGPFRADILCRDTSTGEWVLIENQLETTDHTHLGQLLTYAAGLEAITIVWIARQFTDEHRGALDWLNERTDENVNLFGLEFELWRFHGESSIAPRFNMVSKPNYWTRSVKRATQQSTVTEHNQLQLDFWVAFREYMLQNSRIKCQKPSPQHWMNHAVGTGAAHLASIVSSKNSETGKNNEPEIRVELVLDDASAKVRFAALEEKKVEIEGRLGTSLTWYNPNNKNMCRIYVRTNADFTNRDLWPDQQKWLCENLDAFSKVFGPLLRATKP